MTLTIGSRVFAPSRAATIATLVLLPVLIALGVWQLERADAKRALLSTYAAGADHVVDAGSLAAIDALTRYQRVRVTGRYEPARQVLIDNMPSAQGRPGYRVLTVFELANGEQLLVDRGWVPLGSSRADLPAIPAGAGEQTVTGRIDELPRPAVRLDAGTPPVEAAWPRVMNFPTHAQLEDAYGRRLGARVLLLDPDMPDGFERRRQPTSGFGPERHLGYAVQWFALAATLVAIYVGVNLQPGAVSDPIR